MQPGSPRRWAGSGDRRAQIRVILAACRRQDTVLRTASGTSYSARLALTLAVLALRPVDTVSVVGALAHLLDQRAEPIIVAHLGEVRVERLLATEQLVEVRLDVGALAGVRTELEQPRQ